MFESIYDIYDCVNFMNIFWPVGLILGIVTFLVVLVIFLLMLRAMYISYGIISTEKPTSLYRLTSYKIIICMGSGGHTKEMIEILKNLKCSKYRPRLYIMAENDYSSEAKIHEFEKASRDNQEANIHEFEKGSEDYQVTKIPRGRNVNQSYMSSIFSTIHSTVCTVPIIYRFRPDAILCNGPGTCIPVCAIAFLFKCLFMLNCRIVFVESVCRVRSLSLSGKILQFIADIFIVQWPELKDACLRAQYYGRLS